MLLLFILAVTSIQSQQVKNSSLSDTSYSHHYPSVTDEFVPYFSDGNHFRNRRDSNDDFSATVDQILKISRVINGIALQQGLTKQSIPSDTLITELLNLGSVTPALIQDLKPDEIAALVEEIQSFSKNLIQSDQMDIIEQRFLMYSSMVNKIKAVEKNFGIPESDQYLTDVKKLAGTTEKLTELENSVTIMKTILEQLVALETTMEAAFEVSLKFEAVPQMTKRVKSLDQLKTLFDSKVIGGSIFETLTRVQSAVQEFEDSKAEVTQYDTKNDAIAEKVGENIKKLNTLAGKTKSALPTFHNLNQLFIHRLHRSGNRELTITSGFPNGLSDLQLISDDLKDLWVQSVVDGQSESLAEAMLQLKSFGEAIGSMDASFSLPPGGDQVLRRVYKRAAQLAEISEKFGGLDENTKQFKIDVRKSQMKPTNWDKFNNLMEKIKLLGEQYKATLKVIDLAGKLTGDVKDDLSNMLEIIENSNFETAPTQLKTLRKSLEFKKILNLLRGVEKELNLLKNVQNDVQKSQNKNSTVIGLAKTIGEEYGEVKTYMDGLGGFFDGVDQIRNLKGIDVLGEVIEAVKMFRGFNESALSFEKIKKAIPSVQQKMMDLQVAIDPFKNGQNALVGLQDVLQDTQTIGSASRVFWSMEKVNKIVVLDQKTVKVIQDKMKGVDPEDLKNLDQLLLIDNQLTTVFAQIDGVKKSPLPPLTSDLSSLHPVFSLAATTPGTAMDFLEIGRLVEKLSQDSTLTPEQLQSLLEVRKNLETLDTFGLDYAKHHKDIDESKKALDQMDLFFADYKSKVTVIPTTTGASVESSSQPSSSEAPLHSDVLPGALGPLTEEESTGIGKWFEKHWGWLLAGFIVMLAVAALFYFCIYPRCIKKKKTSLDVHTKVDSDSDSDDEKPGKIKKTKLKSSTVSQISQTPSTQPVVKQEPEKKVVVPMEVETVNEVKEVEPPVPKIQNEQNKEKDVVVLKPKEETNELEVEETQKSMRHNLGKIELGATYYLVVGLTEMSIDHWQKVRADKIREIPEMYARYLINTNETSGGEAGLLADPCNTAYRQYFRYIRKQSRAGQLQLQDKTFYPKRAIHANKIIYPNGKDIILIQGVQTENLKISKKDNIGIFWQAVMEQKSTLILNLTPFHQNNIELCSPYFPTTEDCTATYGDGNVKVKCLKVRNEFEGELIFYRLEVQFVDRKTFIVTLIHYIGWPFRGIPNRTGPVVRMMELVSECLDPVFVHCSDGASTSGVIPLIYHMRLSASEHNGRVQIQESLHYIRKHRDGAVETGEQCVFAVIALFRWIEKGMDKTRRVDIVNQTAKEFDDVAEILLREKPNEYLKRMDKERQIEEKKNGKMRPEELLKVQQKQIDELKKQNEELKKLYRGEGKVEPGEDVTQVERTVSETRVGRASKEGTDGSQKKKGKDST